MNINVLIDNHLPVELADYSLQSLNVNHLREVIESVCPHRLTVFAYGHDGWAQYPSALNSSPPGMGIDLPRLWKSVADEFGVRFALYVSTLRNDRLLAENPQWERVGLNGIPAHRIDHASPYFSEWLRPVLEELQASYQPDGYFFDGDYWTVGESLSTYRAEAAAEYFPELSGNILAQLSPEQHRYVTVKTYSRYVEEIGRLLAPIAPKSSINLAFTLRHPADRPRGLDLVTSDLPPFFAAIDCWIETAVQHREGAEREVVVPLFAEPEGGGRKYIKPLPQLVHEVAPILAMNESLHVYFPMDTSGMLRAGYATLLTDLRGEIDKVAPSLNKLGYQFGPDVYCLSDSDTLLNSQDFSWLRGAAVAASVAGLNMCVAPTSICQSNLADIRLILAPLNLSSSGQRCLDEARKRGVSVMQADFTHANQHLTHGDVSAIVQHYHLGPKSWWSEFSIDRPNGAFIRAFRLGNDRWRLFVFNSVEMGTRLGRHVISRGAARVGHVSVTCHNISITSVDGYVSSVSITGNAVSFSLDGAFAVIDGLFELTT